jgi:lipopolysaccharide transport system permease protein
LLSPLVLLAMVPILLGLGWTLAALGTFVRDLSQVMPLVLSVLLFLGPVIYPRSAAPAPFDKLMVLNPITIPIEALRALMFGHPFPVASAAIYMGVSLVVCWCGFAVFTHLRRVIADAL